MDELKALYYDPTTGYLSLSKLYKKAKEVGIPVTYKQTKEFLQSQQSYQLTKQSRLPSVYNSYFCYHNADEYQCDLMIYDRYTYHSYRYILCVVDIHSRKAAARPLTNKNLNTYLSAFADIVKTDFDGKWPKRFTSDNEFNKRAFIDMLEQHGCHDHDFSEPSELHKNPVIERFHKTLALRLQRWRIGARSHDWPKALPAIIDAYNNSYHRVIRTSPNAVWSGEEPSHQVIRTTNLTFNVGDRVRFRLDKPVLRKGDRQTFSKDTYIINAIIKSKYQLQSNNGTLLKRKRRNYELIHANRTEQGDLPEPEMKIPEPRRAIRSDVDVSNITQGKRQRKAKTIVDV